MQTPAASTPFIANCPIGCAPALGVTDLMLPEGPLRNCPQCGQLVSSIDEAGYWKSMEEFDTEAGTRPEVDTIHRRDRRAGKILDSIRKELGDSSRTVSLLDVGCSSGVFMVAARARGFNAQGVEPAPRAAKSAKAAGFPVFCGTLEQAAFPDRTFDAITILEVIEHLRDPVGLLRECRRILKADGVLAIGTGNACSLTMRVLGTDWDYLQIKRHGGHVSFFSPRSIQVLAHKTGFAVARILTRRVSLATPEAGRNLRYRSLKLVGELLSVWVAISGQGHDLLALLRPRDEPGNRS